VPLTAFQQRKLERMFELLDLNGDGLVDRADFVQRVEAFARLRGWGQGSPELERNLAFALEEWENLRETADTDEDGGVTREEFLRYGDVFLDDRDAVRAYARGDVQLLFDAMDTDGDGRIARDEYRAYLEVHGVDAAGADLFFDHADLDENGRISRREMAHAVEEFLLSQDPDAAGNFLFGPL
jgi:Ca2+-binding EF-hand superfamily protein